MLSPSENGAGDSTSTTVTDPRIEEAKKQKLLDDAEAQAVQAKIELLEKQRLLLEKQNQLADLQRDPATNPVKQAEQATALANALAAQRTAEASAAKALLPTGLPAVTPLEGKVETDEKAGFTVDLITYKCVGTCATTIATMVCRELQPTNKVLVTTERNLARGSVPYLQVTHRLQVLTKAIARQIRSNNQLIEAKALPASVLGIAGMSLPALAQFTAGAVGVLASLASYLQVNYSIKGREIAIKNDALLAAVSGAMLKVKGVNLPVIYTQDFYTITEAPILTAFNDFLDLVDNLHTSRAELAELDATTEKGKQAAPFIQQTDTMLQDAANYIDLITKQGEGDTPPLFIQAAISGHMKQLGITHVLYISVVSSGGETLTRRKLWPGSLPPITYVGGCAVSYLLAKEDGTMMSADTVYCLAELDQRFKGEVGRIQFVTTPPAEARGLLGAHAPETVVPASECCGMH